MKAAGPRTGVVIVRVVGGAAMRIAAAEDPGTMAPGEGACDAEGSLIGLADVGTGPGSGEAVATRAGSPRPAARLLPIHA